MRMLLSRRNDDAGTSRPEEIAMSFRITGLSPEPFAALFSMDDAQLHAHHARRVVAAPGGGYPCRISLTDAAAGDSLILVNYEHLPSDGPYRSRHAVYVRADEQRYDAFDAVPAQLRTRLLSLRAFDRDDLLVFADVVEGARLENAIERAFAVADAHFLHLHFAKPGCYAARVDRA
jgi:Protein of unknown function (DUF1203)